MEKEYEREGGAIDFVAERPSLFMHIEVRQAIG
jgi:hypothetical protein